MGCPPHFYSSTPRSIPVSTATLTLPADDEERKRLAMLRDIKRRTLGPRRSRWG
jgi:hypothetical protein